MSTHLRRTPALRDVVTQLLQADAPLWGLALSKQSGRPTGTVYPLLERLESAGHVASQWEDREHSGPRRRLYRLTPSGRTWALAQVDASRAVTSDRERQADAAAVAGVQTA